MKGHGVRKRTGSMSHETLVGRRERCGLLGEMEASGRFGVGSCHDLPEGTGGGQEGRGDTSEVAATKTMHQM